MTGPEEATAEASPAHTTVVSVVVADDHPMWRDAVARDLTDAGSMWSPPLMMVPVR